MLILIPLVVFSAVIVGRYLRIAAKDEVKIGEKYFKIIQVTCLLLTSLTLIYLASSNWWFILAFFLGAVIAHFLKARWLFIGIALASAMLASSNITLFVAALLFVYGLPYGTLNDRIGRNFILFAIPFLILLARGQALDYLPLIAGFGAGTLFLRE